MLTIDRYYYCNRVESKAMSTLYYRRSLHNDRIAVSIPACHAGDQGDATFLDFVKHLVLSHVWFNMITIIIYIFLQLRTTA